MTDAVATPAAPVETPVEVEASVAQVETPVASESAPAATESVPAETSEAAAVSYNATLLKKILDQVEFYFSDVNLTGDKFLMEQVRSNGEGWVSIALVASFKRMQALTQELGAVVYALRQSEELLEVDETGANVRRRLPLGQGLDLFKTSVYVKGFPTSLTLEQLQGFFAQQGVRPVAIRMRRHLKDKAFKGSVFVEFASEGEATALLAAQTEAPMKYAETVLEVKSKGGYFESKQAELAAKMAKKAAANAPVDLYQPNRLVKVTGLPTGTSPLVLRQKLNELTTVAFVSLVEGEDGAAFVRLRDADADALVAKVAQEGGLALSPEVSLQVALPGDEEEKAYYVGAAKDLADVQKNKRRGGPSGGGRGGRGGRKFQKRQ